MRVHEQAGLHHPGQTHKLASGHWAPCTTLEGIGLTDLLQTEGLFCSWEACGKQGPTWRTERVGVRLSIIGSLLWFTSSVVCTVPAESGYVVCNLMASETQFSSNAGHSAPVFRTRNITFEGRLLWFMSYRTRNITVIWSALVLAYGLEQGLLSLERAKWLENRGRSNRGEMTWGRNERLLSGQVLLLSTNQGNGKKLRITVVFLFLF